MGRNERWAVHDRYREEGWSGKNLDRPELQRMMRDVEAGLIDVIVVYEIDRISRSIRDFLDLYETFERRNVQFVSVHEAFDTTTGIGRATRKLVLVLAELEREQTAERTQATMEHRARQGPWNGGRPTARVRPLPRPQGGFVPEPGGGVSRRRTRL